MNKGRNHTWQKRPNNNFITSSICGLFFTVDGDDKRALREALNVIDQFLPKSSADNKSMEMKDALHVQEDVSDVLLKMCSSTRDGTTSEKTSRNNEIRQLDTGVKHTFFFTAPNVFTPENVYCVADKMVEECQKTPRCRFLARVVPVEDTCVGDVSALPDRIAYIVAKHLKEDDSVQAPSYAVDFRARNSDLLNRNTVIDIVTEVMQAQSPSSRVNLSKPDLLIMVNVMRKAILLSCVRCYAERNKFSVRPPSISVSNNSTQLSVDGEKV